MQKGWLKDGGFWYWLDSETCAMQTGLVSVDGRAYLLDNSGIIQTGW
jgi:glucan-binding YG repeat protein